MKQFIFIVALLLALPATMRAQRSFELPLWTGDEVKDDRADARLLVFLADEPTGQAVVACPGGGYRFLSMQNEGIWFARLFNPNGISLMVLKYRLPKQRHTVPLEDAEQAMRIVRSHAAEWGVDTANVGIMGSSAGGHLATTLATHYHSKATRPDFQILLYPVVTMDKSFTDQGTHDNLIGKDASPEMEELYSNEKHVTDDTPRAFIIFSSNDRTVPLKNGFLYAQAMVDHKIPVSLHVYPDGYHGFGYNPDFKDADIWHKELLRWLKRNGK